MTSNRKFKNGDRVLIRRSVKFRDGAWFHFCHALGMEPNAVYRGLVELTDFGTVNVIVSPKTWLFNTDYQQRWRLNWFDVIDINEELEE